MDDKKPTIYIADDDPHLTELIASLFNRLGYPTINFTDGEQVLETLSAQPEPGALILDPLLPYTDGYQLIRRIRSNPDTADMPIILLSNRTQEQDVVDAFSQQVNDVMSKPFQPRELIARVLRWINQQPLPPYKEHVL